MPWYEKPTILSKIFKQNNYIFIDESGDIKDLSRVSKKIKNGEKIEVRDSTFVLTAVYTKSKNLEYIYASLNEFKKIYCKDQKIILHSTDIYRNFDSSKYTICKSEFIEKYNDLLCSYKFFVISTAINKYKYCQKYSLDSTKATDTILGIYEREFLKLECMLKKLRENAIYVLEESSNPKIDRKILRLFVYMRKKRKIINSKALYFVKKTSKCYPSGMEITDFSSRAIFNYFSNVEFYNTLKKCFDSNLLNFKNLEFYDKNPNLIDFKSLNF